MTTRLIFLSLPQICLRAALPFSSPHKGAMLQHLKQNPPADLVKSLTELTEQRALTETVKMCQSFLHSPRRRCQAALLLLQAAQTASPPSLCHMHQTTSEYSLQSPHFKYPRVENASNEILCQLWVVSGLCTGKHSNHDIHDDGSPLCDTDSSNWAPFPTSKL